MAEDRAADRTVGVKDKVVLVTGASRGIGACCVRALLEGGASVVLHYNTRREAAEALAQAAPERCQPAQADLADDDAAQALWQAALAWRGRIDVLVNNAAVYEPEPALAADHADPAWAPAWRAAWRRTLQINLVAPAELATLAVAHFRARGGGILIHLSSRAAHRGEKPLLGAYAASKAGLNALSHTIARNDGAAGVPLLRGGPRLGRHRHVVGLYRGDRRPRTACGERARHPDPARGGGEHRDLPSLRRRPPRHRHRNRHQWGELSEVGRPVFIAARLVL